MKYLAALVPLLACAAQATPIIKTERAFHSSNASLAERQVSYRLKPYSGQTPIIYGCDIDIVAQVFSLVGELCPSESCDEGAEKTLDVQTPDGGYFQDGTLTIKADGFWPLWMRNAMFETLNALVVPEAVSKEYVETDNVIGSPYTLPSHAACEVYTAANFYAVRVVEDDADEGLIAELKVYVEYEEKEGFDWCGFFLGAAGVVIGKASGSAGGTVGVIADPLCEAIS